MANIKLNNNEYPIPDSKLASIAADFVAHLGKIAGNGMKVVVGGVEYGVDSTKLNNAVISLEAVFNTLSGVDEPELPGGLYETGAIALYKEQGASAVEGMMTTSWDELVANGTVHVKDGVVYSNLNTNSNENASSDALAGDLILPNDGSITKLGDYYKEYDNGRVAFKSCYNLTSVYIPNSVTSISDYALASCYSLTSVVIPSGVTKIGRLAFLNCGDMTSIIFEGTIEQWNSIDKGSAWDSSTGNYTVYCIDGNIIYEPPAES